MGVPQRSFRSNVAEHPTGRVLGEPSDLVRAKIADRLNALTRRFVDRSPFLLLATFAADGTGE